MTGDARQHRLSDDYWIGRILDEGASVLDTSLSWERARLLAEAHGWHAHGASPGGRFVASQSWQAYREDSSGVGFSGQSVSAPVLRADEVGGWFTAATLGEFLRESRSQQVAVRPLPSTVADLVNVEPTDTRRVRRIEIGVTEPTGGGVIAGAAAPEVVMDASGTDQLDTFRWSVHGNVDRVSLVTDDAFAARVVNTLLATVLRRQIAFEIVMGAGTTVGDRRQLLGINSASGVNTVAFATNRVSTLLAGIEAVEVDGFTEGQVTLVGHPTDIRELLDEATWRRDRFPRLGRIVPFDKLTAGTMYAGVFSEADLYVLGDDGVTVEVSQDHADNFARGTATVTATMFTVLDVQAPDGKSAFVKMTGM